MGRFDFIVRDTRRDTYFCKSIELLFQIPNSSYCDKNGCRCSFTRKNKGRQSRITKLRCQSSSTKILTKCDFLLRPPLILMVDYRRRFIEMMMLEITIYGALHYSIRADLCDMNHF